MKVTRNADSNVGLWVLEDKHVLENEMVHRIIVTQNGKIGDRMTKILNFFVLVDLLKKKVYKNSFKLARYYAESWCANESEIFDMADR